MKTIHLLLLFFLLLSCETDKNPLDPGNNFIIPLNTGNTFNYHVFTHTETVLADVFEYHNVTGNILINHTKYAIIDNNKLIRSDGTRLWSYNNGRETILLEYNVNAGDIITFLGKIATVDSIKQQDVFGMDQKVIYVSNHVSVNDTLVTGQYTATFGILNYVENYDHLISGYRLRGARIGGKEFGIVD